MTELEDADLLMCLARPSYCEEKATIRRYPKYLEPDDDSGCKRTRLGQKVYAELQRRHRLMRYETRYGDAWAPGMGLTCEQAQACRFRAGQAIEILTGRGWMRWRFETSGKNAAIHIDGPGGPLVALVGEDDLVYARVGN